MASRVLPPTRHRRHTLLHRCFHAFLPACPLSYAGKPSTYPKAPQQSALALPCTQVHGSAAAGWATLDEALSSGKSATNVPPDVSNTGQVLDISIAAVHKSACPEGALQSGVLQALLACCTPPAADGQLLPLLLPPSPSPLVRIMRLCRTIPPGNPSPPQNTSARMAGDFDKAADLYLGGLFEKINAAGQVRCWVVSRLDRARQV